MKIKEASIILVVLIVVVLLFFISNYTGRVVQTQSSITVSGCGDGNCSIGETCSNCPRDCGNCAVQQPSGGGVSVVRDFSINKDLIKISLKQGETKREILEIKNTGNTALNIFINSTGLNRFVLVSEESLSISPGESKIINIDFFAKEDEKPDVYTGRIIVSSENIKKIVNVIIEIKEKTALFDISIKVKNKIVAPGDNLQASIEMTNLGELNNIDVLLYYAIKNFDNKIILFREESLAVDKKLVVERELQIPKDIEYGNYIFYSRITYGKNQTASSSDSFSIVGREEILKQNLIKTGIVIIILTVITLVILFFRKKRYKT